MQVHHVALVGLALVLVAAPTYADEARSKRIVVLHDETTTVADERSERLLARGERLVARINARAVELSDAEVMELRKNPRVAYIEDDVIFNILARTSGSQGQIVPWGVDRIDAEKSTAQGSTGESLSVGVIDTGISTKHPDLSARLKGGVNTIRIGRSYNDDNGHGSHVAGIIAASNNTFGVVGVAPSVRLYAIKALNAYGSGYLSDIIEGIDWAIGARLDVINMSLGSSVDSPTLQDAIARAEAAGVLVVAAAGNDGGPVLFPAAYPTVLAVGATDSGDVRPSWSNQGAALDLVAPGVSIYSTYKQTGYATLSGTSMATPHVSGAALVWKAGPIGSYDANLNGVWDVGELRTALTTTAYDLGVLGYDTFYGHGLVTAWRGW